MNKNSQMGKRPGFVQALLQAYLNPRVMAVLLLGIASGLPLALTGSTLSVWLSEAGVSRSSIGLFTLVGTAYTWKFLWAPQLDIWQPPLLSRLGRRRGWGMLALAGLMGFTLLTGMSSPKEQLMLVAVGAVGVAFFSATLDIVIDAYRIEILKEEEQGAGSAVIVYGYRVGMLISGGGCLYLAEAFGWFVAYAVMAGVMLLAIILFICLPEPAPPAATPVNVQRSQGLSGWLKKSLIDPFVSFAEAQPQWLAILIFAVLYKLGDAFAGAMTSPFYVGLGVNKIDIANIAKGWGLIATLVGVFLGGALVSRLGIMKGLLIGGICQMLSNLVFIAQAQAGADLTMLSVTVFVENVTGGMGTAPFVAYLSRVSQREFSASHYALLSALASFGRTSLASVSGYLADKVSWELFFGISTLAAVPGLIVLVWLIRRGEGQAAAPAEGAGPSGR